MDSSVLAVIIFGTLLFIGFAVWLAFYSRRTPIDDQTPNERKSRQTKDIGKGRLEKG